MHMLIRILVPADDKDEAVLNAQSALHQLIEAGAFDSYSLGPDSCMDEMPEPASIATTTGQKQARKAFADSKAEFIENIIAFRNTLDNFTTDELFETNPGEKEDPDYNCHLFRHLCRQLGMDRGTGVSLYDENGCGILTTREFEDALKQKNLWVVPADVHC